MTSLQGSHLREKTAFFTQKWDGDTMGRGHNGTGAQRPSLSMILAPGCWKAVRPEEGRLGGGGGGGISISLVGSGLGEGCVICRDPSCLSYFIVLVRVGLVTGLDVRTAAISHGHVK